MKTYIYIILMITCTNLMGQPYKLKEVLNVYQSGDLKTAAMMINNVEGEKDVNYWYLRGFIYKDMFKQSQKVLRDSCRNEGLEAFFNLLKVDTEKQYIEDAEQNIKFLSVSYFNDAVANMNNKRYDESKIYFDQYIEVCHKANFMKVNASGKEIEYLMALGTAYTTEHDSHTADTVYFYKAIGAYQSVLDIDSLHLKANYNIGVLYYNKAVSLITELEFEEVDLVAFSEIEDKSIELFRASLPYMLRAHKANSKDKNTIEGLSGIYFSLREFDKSDYYKEMLDKIGK